VAFVLTIIVTAPSKGSPLKFFYNTFDRALVALSVKK